MNEELEKLYLQNIEEYIFDEDKIVTYKWLSKTLNVHVNTAKQLLYTFSTEIESNRKPELQLTYLVGGLLHDGKGCRFQVVREDDLLKVKNQFKVVTSEHIYSIHKSKRLSDLNILYGIDCIRESEDGGTMQGSIHCKKSVRRLEEQLAELRLQSRAASLCGNGKLIPQVTKNNSVKQCDKKPKSEETAQKKEKPSLFTTVSSKPSKPDKDVDNKSADPVESTANNKKTKPSGTIASMFSAQSSKPKKTDSSVQKKTTTSEEAARTVASKSKEAGSISTMFANQSSKSKPKIETKQQAEEQGSGISSDADLKAAVEEKDITEKPTTAKRKHQTSEKAKSASKAKGKKPKKSSNDSNSQPAKKRKRIMIASDTDSSDDDIFGKEEDDGEEEEDRRDLEPEPDDSDVIPSTPQQEPNRGRKRKKKMVDRTFTDEEGYVITKKEYVYESCSGSEAEEEKKEDTKVPPKGASETVKTEVSVKPSKGAPSKKNSSPKKKQSPPQKAKQMTLTSFFKKN